MHINVKRRFNRLAININMTNIDFGYLFRLTDWKLWVKTAKLTYLFKCELAKAIRYEFDLFSWYGPNHYQFSKNHSFSFAFFSITLFHSLISLSHSRFFCLPTTDGQITTDFIEMIGIVNICTLECLCVFVCEPCLALCARCICMEYTES